MNYRSDRIGNFDRNHVAKAEEKIVNSLNSLEGGGSSFVENLPNSSELIIQESSGDAIIYPNQNEMLFSQGDGTGIGETSCMPVCEEPDLPPTTIVFNTSWGPKIYVVGTSHFSIESQEDVAKVIRAVQPNYVVLELCPSRSYMLTWTEEKLEMAQNMDYKILIKEAVNKYGVFHGLIQVLLLSLSFQITREMGMAPGGEFRRAFKEARAIPGCVVYLGDRPIETTFRRAFASMSWWQCLKLAYSIVFSKSEINKDEIEKCKNRDYLGNMLEMFGGEFPGLKEVFVNERDSYLTYMLVNTSMLVNSEEKYPNAVVGVVGMGHLAGIQRNFESGRLLEFHEMLRVSENPPQSRTSKVLIFTIKTSLFCLALYGLHKLASRTRFYPPSIPLFG